jgi:hypothetical protein
MATVIKLFKDQQDPKWKAIYNLFCGKKEPGFFLSYDQMMARLCTRKVPL